MLTFLINMVELSSKTCHSAFYSSIDGHAQCFTDLKLIIMGLRYHLCAISVLVAARTAVVPMPMISGKSGAVRRDRCQSE